MGFPEGRGRFLPPIRVWGSRLTWLGGCQGPCYSCVVHDFARLNDQPRGVLDNADDAIVDGVGHLRAEANDDELLTKAATCGLLGSLRAPGRDFPAGLGFDLISI